MGGGQVFVVTLAALAAVFLQGCGKKAVAPLPATVQTTLTAPVAKGATVLQVANTAGLLPNTKVTIADAKSGASEVNAISTVGSIVLMTGTQNAYGVSTTITMNTADGGKATTLAAIQTAKTAVTRITPAYIRPGTATAIVMNGTGIAAGDKLSFGAACGLNASIGEVMPATAVTVTTATSKDAAGNLVQGTSTAEVTMKTAGTYKLCYQQAGKTDSVAQTSIELFVQAAGAADYFLKITGVGTAAPDCTEGTVCEITLDTKVAKGDKVAFVKAGTVCPLASDFGWTAYTEDIAAGKAKVSTTAGMKPGEYSLCYNSAKQYPIKQTNAATKLTIKAKTARLYGLVDADADNNKPENSAKTMILGAGGLVFVAFVVVAVKRTKSDVRTMVPSHDEDEELQEGLE